jgi:hypothetical protein
MDDLHKIDGELPTVLDATANSKGTPAPGSTTYTTALDSVPYTIDKAIADSIEQLTGEPFPDPFTGEHDIQYWIWTGDRLVPASPEAAERLHQQELLEREEQLRRRERQQAARRQRVDTIVNSAWRLVAPLWGLVAKWRGVDRGTRHYPGALEAKMPERSRRSE